MNWKYVHFNIKHDIFTDKTNLSYDGFFPVCGFMVYIVNKLIIHLSYIFQY